MLYRDFTKLKIWQEAHALTLEVYTFTSAFPREELFGLVSQLRRSSVSIAANIAEGTGRNSVDDFCRFLAIARGSANEAVSHCMIARDLRFLSDLQANPLISRYRGLAAGIQECAKAVRI
jgi:four helix bundle protein